MCWRIIGDRVLVGDGQGECRGGSGEECRGYWMLMVMGKGEPVVGSAGGDKVQKYRWEK